MNVQKAIEVWGLQNRIIVSMVSSFLAWLVDTSFVYLAENISCPDYCSLKAILVSESKPKLRPQQMIAAID